MDLCALGNRSYLFVARQVEANMKIKIFFQLTYLLLTKRINVFRIDKCIFFLHISADGVHAFINSNYKEVLNEVGGPILENIYKKVIKNVKKMLRHLPLDEYFV